MGFNLIRWLTSEQYRAIKRWKRARGDETLRYDYNLTEDAVVFDVGAYVGEFAIGVSRRFGCRVEAFEPVPDFARQCIANTTEYPNVRVHDYGLSNKDEAVAMTVEGLASSSYRESGQKIAAEFRDIDKVWTEFDIDRIDVLKLNVEGGEYDILPRLIETGRIHQVENILVQFHLINFGDRDRYNKLATDLDRSHSCAWRFPFIWELWRRNR